jgi:RNA recognition motif-containing protein
MSASVENNLFNNSISAIGDVDPSNHSINTYSENLQQENNDRDNTMNDLSHNFNDESQNLNEEQQKQEPQDNEPESEFKINVTQDTTYGSENNTTTTKNTQENNNHPPSHENEDAKSQADSHKENHTLEPEQFRKVFIGGLSYKTDSETLKEYFSKFGELVDHVVMKDRTGKAKGFGFVTYARSSMVDEMMRNRPHTLDGRQVEAKRATPREDSGRKEVQATVKKLFVGGLRETISEQDLKDYFSQYGNIVEIFIMKDKETNKPRGFCFVTFDDYDPVDKIIRKF